MAPEKKVYWKELARIDMARFEDEKAHYHGSWKVPANSPQAKDPTRPRKPVPAYFAFSNSRRQSVKDQNINASNAEISKILSRMWQETPEEQKREYVEEEARQRETYNKEMEEWRKTKAQQDDIPLTNPGIANESIQHANTRPQQVQMPAAAVAAHPYPSTIMFPNPPSNNAHSTGPASAPLQQQTPQNQAAVQQAAQAALAAMLLQQPMLLQQILTSSGARNGQQQQQSMAPQATPQQLQQAQPASFQGNNMQQQQHQVQLPQENFVQAMQWAMSMNQGRQNVGVAVEEAKSTGSNASNGGQPGAPDNGGGGGGGNQNIYGLLGPLLSVSLQGTASSEIPHRISPQPPSPPPLAQGVTNEQATILGRLVLAAFQQHGNVGDNQIPQVPSIPQAVAVQAPAPPAAAAPASHQPNQQMNIFNMMAQQGAAAALPVNAIAAPMPAPAAALLGAALQSLQQQQAPPQQQLPPRQQDHPQQLPQETIQLLALTNFFLASADESNNGNTNSNNQSNQGS